VCFRRNVTLSNWYATAAICVSAPTASTGTLLSSCQSGRANWWRNKLCYRENRTDNRHRDLKFNSESLINRPSSCLTNVNRKKGLSNDDVTCFRTARNKQTKKTSVNYIAEFVALFSLSFSLSLSFLPRPLILMGLQWWLVITDCSDVTSFLVQSST